MTMPVHNWMMVPVRNRPIVPTPTPPPPPTPFLKTVFIDKSFGTSWPVPTDFPGIATVLCFGPGGGGAGSFTGFGGQGGGGGGGGAFGIGILSGLPTSGLIPINVGAGGLGGGVNANGQNGGSGTWFNATSLANAAANGTGTSCAADFGLGGQRTVG